MDQLFLFVLIQLETTWRETRTSSRTIIWNTRIINSAARKWRRNWATSYQSYQVKQFCLCLREREMHVQRIQWKSLPQMMINCHLTYTMLVPWYCYSILPLRCVVSLAGMIDCPGVQDGSSLRSLIEKPPVCGNSFSPLTGALLTGFRLHTGPVN